MEKYGINISDDQQLDIKPDIKAIPTLFCTICQQIFNQKQDLIIHVKDHFKTYECEYCSKKFIGDTKFNFHLIHDHNRLYEQDKLKPKRLLTGIIQYPCDFCNDVYLSKYMLTRHQRKVHRDKIVIPKPFQCDVCKQHFESYGVIKAHMRIHDIGEFMCEVCGKKFAKKTNLQTHVRIHTGERIFHCENCGKSFTSASALFVHRRTHTGVRPYQCTWCEKSYAHSTDLRRHKRIHTGEPKKLKCDLCEQRFYENKFLLQHQRIHHQMHQSKQWQKPNEKINDDSSSSIKYEREELVDGVLTTSKTMLSHSFNNN